MDDAPLTLAIGQRDVRQLSIANNSVYLGCGVRHFSRALMSSKQDVEILRGFIDLADWSFIHRSSIPPMLQVLCDPRTLAKSLNSLLTRVDSKPNNEGDV